MSTSGKAAGRKALIVGISDYTKLEELNICKNDGTEVYKVLSSLGYEISDKNKLLGEVKGIEVKDAIYDFFGDIRVNPDDTLLFYYSGHGVFDVDGEVYLASSDIDPEEPYRRGFSLEELTKMMQRSISTRVVVILDCCHSGSVPGKGNAEEATNKAIKAIDEKSKKLQGQRKCILAACQATQFAYTTREHSLFTQYLLQGLNGDTESIDNDGNVTPESLGNYVERKIMKLPDNNRRQRPITRAEGSGNIILASYPKLKPLKIEDTLASMLKLLREGNVEEFNKMREANSAILPEPDFSMGNLHGAHIPGANLSNANLKRINLSAADLEGANLSDANLFRADLEGANLSKTNFSKAVLEASNLSTANLAKSNLSNANLARANLSYANIFSADLEQTKLIGANLVGANLTNINDLGADFRGAIFEEQKSIDIDSVTKLAKKGTSTLEVKGRLSGFPGRKYQLLIPIVVAAVVCIFIFIPFTSIISHPINSPSVPATNIILSSTNKIIPVNNMITATHYLVKQVWGKSGSKDSQFNDPVGVAVDSAGNVYVADEGNNRVQKFDSNGNFIATWGTSGSGNGQFNDPVDVAVDSSGSLYVANKGNNCIQKFDSNGTFITSWGNSGSDHGQLSEPVGVTVDHIGNVYVTDPGNNRIQKFSSNGNFIAAWGTLGSSNGQFNDPGGVATDHIGNVYVADTLNNRLHGLRQVIEKYTCSVSTPQNVQKYASTTSNVHVTMIYLICFERSKPNASG
ncbi:MAG: pentapeptide repeat-containing protein [Candidatus Nitrosopolaris sp.]